MQPHSYGIMDTASSRHSLASILVSLAEPKGQNRELSLASHVAQQLQVSHGEEKDVLAEVLVALLSKCEDKHAEHALSKFVHDLVFTTSSSEEKTHKNLQLGARIALSPLNLLPGLVEQAKGSVLALLFSASRTHVVSDDAFEVDFQLFIETHYPQVSDLKLTKNPESSEFSNLYSTVITRLGFLKIVLLTETNSAESTRIIAHHFHALPALLLPLIGLRNEKVSMLSCNIFRLLLGRLDTLLPEGTSEMIWEGIQILLKASSHIDLAFSTWLCWVSLSGSTSRPSQKMLEDSKYWSLLQTGLVTGFNERRKFCLYILNSSLQLSSERINNTLLKYDPSSPKDSAAWAKYSTMIEIVSLSTSTNQFLAAVPDICRLLKPFSPIFGSWIVVLMTLGLTSSCGPLQKATWEFLLSIKGVELKKLLNSEKRSFVNDVFLPYSTAAHHFSVQRRNDGRCEYGDRLAGFLKKVIIQNQDAAGLLKFLDARQDTIFAPARVYVLKGIVGGVAALPSEIGFRKEDLAAIVRISKMRRFGLMKTDLCISMCIKLLLLTNLEHVGLEDIYDALTEILAGKEYLITIALIKSLKEFIDINKPRNTNLETALHELGTSSLTLEDENDPSSKTVLGVAILLTLIGDGKRRQTEFDLFFKNDIETRPRMGKRVNKTVVRLLALLFSTKGLVGDWLQDPASRKILAVTLDESINYFLEDTQEDGYLAELANLLHHQRENRVLNFVSTQRVLALFRKAWPIACLLQDGRSFDLETEKLRGELLGICDAAGCALVSKGAMDGIQATFASKAEVLNLISKVPIPVFDQNKHENTVKLKFTSKFLYYAYGLLNTSICQFSNHELDHRFVEILFNTTRRMLRYINKGSLLRVLECIRIVSHSSPAIVGSYPELDSLVRELWECAHLKSPVAEESLLEVSLIKTVFDTSIICTSLNTNKVLTDTLSNIGKEIIKLCKGKRSLAPAFAKSLRQGYLDSPDVFCSCEWPVDILLDFINFAPSREPEFIVETSMARIFDETFSEPNHYDLYYEEKEEMAQVYIFDILSRLDPRSPAESTFASSLGIKIFDPWKLNKPGMPVYSKWKKASQLQALLILGRFITAEKSASFLDTTITTLCNEPHPRYRFLFEWIIALCVVRFPQNRDCLWGYLQAPENPNPRLQASLLRIAIMTARELQGDLKESFYTELLYTVIPLSNNNKVAVRHQATSMVLELWDELAQWQHLRDNLVFQRLRQSILNSNFFKQVTAAGEMENERTFDAKSNYTFTGIFSGRYLLGGDEADIIPPELFSAVRSQDYKKISFIPIGSAQQLEGSSGRVEYTKTEETALVEAPLQTKSGTWDAKAFIEANEHRKSRTSLHKHNGPDIIVIASLIENAYNLGGLSRVSEIMGVKTLCFHSKDILKSKDFTSVSVSSEVWLPILELKATSIPEFIRAKKFEGYSAVGIEQTDKSIILGKEGYKLPKKVVLLLGSEKFGIPAELLTELDLCVEIQQKGETRSMNVQTAAAVVLYEFCRQFG